VSGRLMADTANRMRSSRNNLDKSKNDGPNAECAQKIRNYGGARS
jgi:hypothetical protein